MKRITQAQILNGPMAEKHKESLENQKQAIAESAKAKQEANQPKPGMFNPGKKYCWLTGQTITYTT